MTGSNFNGSGVGPFRAGNDINAQRPLDAVNALNRIPLDAITARNEADHNHNQHPHKYNDNNNLDNCYNAFDNPYFSDARKDCLQAQQQLKQQQQQICSPEAQQLHFIENRISTLHSKQVTSSVNELTANERLQAGKCSR